MSQLEGTPVSNPAGVTCSWHGAAVCACQLPAHTATLPGPLRGLQVCLGSWRISSGACRGQAAAADVGRQCLERKVPGETSAGNLLVEISGNHPPPSHTCSWPPEHRSCG